MTTLRILFSFLFLSSLSISFISGHVYADNSQSDAPYIDLTQVDWGQGKQYDLDGHWHLYWGELIPPTQIEQSNATVSQFPVPGVWTDTSLDTQVLPAMGYATYRMKVQVPKDIATYYLYAPDMPSAYKLWVNGDLLLQNGETGKTPSDEQPGFIPQVVEIDGHAGELDIVIHLSNYHYREGGIWFSLKLTDESGVFAMRDQPIIFAVFAGAILIALGVYNSLLFAFRSKEIAALYFGVLCIVVGVRRLLIDERVVYSFDLFSWATLQRVEHLCFYIALPLFIGFFISLFPQKSRFSIPRMAWMLITPFVFICLFFPARIYTELNVVFQVLVIIGVCSVLYVYFKELKERGRQVAGFGISLLVLFLAVLHDVLKANDVFDTPNIAHFGVFAFVVTQSIAFQRRYLNSLNLVESMSQELSMRNEELIKMDEFKDEFLANTSHELRTPLHGIAGLAKVLQDEDHGRFDSEQRAKIDLIANTTKRLSMLVNDILDFSSIKHSKLKLNLAVVDLEAMAKLVISTLSPIVSDKPVVLRASIDPDVRYLYADEYRLQQILFNLLGNSSKFTERGHIELRAFWAEELDQVVLEVEDTGVGIPKEKRDTLFRPFEQAHVDGELNAGGTGLGLTISQQLVELHGGSLSVDSDLGEGTTIQIHLPERLIRSADEFTSYDAKENLLENSDDYSQVESPNDSAASLHESVSIQPQLGGAEKVKLVDESSLLDDHKPLIYVVDDELVNRELVKSQLKDRGYRIETFADGMSFLARVNEQIPDLVLLDFMMPRMNGLEVCTSLRRKYDSYEVPVMILTARHQISDIVKALGVGANDYLVKPYHDQELVARVSSQLTTRKYWIANRENIKLKHEIERREALEEELHELNTRLLTVLDVSDDLVLLVNQRHQVVYANEKAKEVLSEHVSQEEGQSGKLLSLLGYASESLFNKSINKAIAEALGAKPGQALVLESEEVNEDLLCRVSLKYFENAGSGFLVLVLSRADAAASGDDPAHALIDLTRELSESRRKINQIEGALKLIGSVDSISVEPVASMKADQGAALPEPETNSDDSQDVSETSTQRTNEAETGYDAAQLNKELVVALHRATLNLWERYSGKGKAQLAEESRCWRVYIDGTTVKTRTFDKYLSVKTVPDKPRWRSVVRTANYVLSHCDLTQDDKLELQNLCESVEDKFA